MSIFSHISVPSLRKSLYRYNFEHKMSYRMGYLLPVKVIPILPGDKILSLSVESFTRMAPMIFPVMHRMNIKLYAFFVPNRIVWDHWEDYITGGPDGSLAPVKPFFNMSTIQSGYHDYNNIGTLNDYLGVPVSVMKDGTFNKNYKYHSLKHRGYQLIWNEYFRDQNLQDPVAIYTASDGDEMEVEPSDGLELLKLRKKCWQKDYFTSALPWLQRGPLTQMPVNVDLSEGNVILSDSMPSEPGLQFRSDKSNLTDNPNITYNSQQSSRDGYLANAADSKLSPLNLSDFLDAQLSASNPDVGSFLIEDLRRAVKLQEWREKNARGGARYTEQILSHFGVRSSDARLQRPEFLGATSQPISISEVLQSSESSSEGTPLGEMGGHGISARGALLCRNKFFEEHGYVFVLMTCLPRTGYFQGFERDFLKFDKFEEYWPEFAHIGEQPIYKEELLFNQSDAEFQVFGYTPRYAEYQYFPDTIAGEFRTSLKAWHMAREIDNAALNGDFVTCNPTNRVFPVQYQDVEQMYGQFLFHLNMRRPVLKGASPRL